MNSGQTTGAPLLINVSNVEFTSTIIEELIKLQFEAISFSKIIVNVFLKSNSFEYRMVHFH